MSGNRSTADFETVAIETETDHMTKAQLAAFKEQKKREAEERRIARDKLIAATLKEEGESALQDIQPIMLKADLQTDDPEEAFLVPGSTLDWQINPLFDAVMLKCGASKRGGRTYAVQMHEKGNKNNLLAILSALPSGAVYAAETVAKIHKKGGHRRNWSVNWEVRMLIAGTPLGKTLSNSDFSVLRGPNNQSWNQSSEEFQRVMVQLSVAGNELFIKIMTVADEDSKELLFFTGAPDLHLWKRDNSRDAIVTTADIAIQLMESARAETIPVMAHAGYEKLENVLKQSLIAQVVPGSPGEARVVVGIEAEAPAGLKMTNGEQFTFATSYITTAKRAGKLLESSNVEYKFLHTGVTDVINMELAPLVEYEGLYSHQNQAVRLHLATELGYINASSVGLGKSICAAVGMRERAKIRPNYLALVSARHSLVGQWISEIARWFPEARVFLAKSSNEKALHKFMSEERTKPTIILASYGVVKKKKNLDMFKTHHWDDLILDEAAFLKSQSTGQSVAFRELRPHAEVAVALTGTPIDKSLDDLGALLAWVRNDTSMFYARRLSTRFDVSKKKDLKALRETIGPALFRVDTADAGVKMPEYQVRVEMVEPHADELALADAGRNQLKQILIDIADNLQEEADKATAEGDDEMADVYLQAKEDIRKSPGTILGGVTLARMSASDAISVKTSESLGAAVLDQAGLVDPAVANGGSKRRQAAADIKERVESGLGVLVFSDFVSAGDRLAEELRGMGINAVRFGGSSPEDIEACKADFQGSPCREHNNYPLAQPDCAACTQPTTDVLILGKSGQEGLNLQRAGVIVNYDLNWMPSSFLQRVGRASRIGSLHDRLEVLIYLVEGTIEERIAAVLVPRAMESLAVLDLSRGVEAKNSVLSGLGKQLATKISQEEQEAAASSSIFEMARKIILEED